MASPLKITLWTSSAFGPGTLRNLVCYLRRSTPEPAGTSSAICPGTLRSHHQLLQNLLRYLPRNHNLISHLHRNPPEPHRPSAPEPSGTLRNLLRNLVLQLHRIAPELFWAKDPIASFAVGEKRTKIQFHADQNHWFRWATHAAPADQWPAFRKLAVTGGKKKKEKMAKSGKQKCAVLFGTISNFTTKNKVSLLFEGRCPFIAPNKTLVFKIGLIGKDLILSDLEVANPASKLETCCNHPSLDGSKHKRD